MGGNQSINVTPSEGIQVAPEPNIQFIFKVSEEESYEMLKKKYPNTDFQTDLEAIELVKRRSVDLVLQYNPRKLTTDQKKQMWIEFLSKNADMLVEVKEVMIRTNVDSLDSSIEDTKTLLYEAVYQFPQVFVVETNKCFEIKVGNEAHATWALKVANYLNYLNYGNRFYRSMESHLVFIAIYNEAPI